MVAQKHKLDTEYSCYVQVNGQHCHELEGGDGNAHEDPLMSSSRLPNDTHQNIDNE